MHTAVDHTARLGEIGEHSGAHHLLRLIQINLRWPRQTQGIGNGEKVVGHSAGRSITNIVDAVRPATLHGSNTYRRQVIHMDAIGIG